MHQDSRKLFAQKIADHLSLKLIMQHPSVQAKVITDLPPAISMPCGEPLIIQSSSSLEDTLAHVDITDWMITDKERYNVAEYLNHANINDNALRRELIETFDLVYDIMQDTKGQLEMLTEDRMLNALDELHDALSTDSKQVLDNTLTTFADKLDSLEERALELAGALKHVAGAMATDSLHQMALAARMSELKSQGRHEEAAKIEQYLWSRHEMISIASKVVDNVTHLPEFVLGVSRGGLQLLRTGKDMVVEPMLDTLRTPKEYQQAIEQRIATWDNIIESLESITPEQATELQHTFIADIVTLHALAKCTKQVKAQIGASSSSSTAPTPKQTAAQLEQQKVQAPKSEASASQGLQVDKRKGKQPTSEAKVYKPAKEELRKAEKFKDQSDEIETILKEAKAQKKARQSKICPEHKVEKHKGKHKVTEFTEGDHQQLWDEHVPSDLEIDKIAKPFDHTMRTHTDPRLPKHMLESPKSIRFEHEHIRKPDIRVQCLKNPELHSVSGFHHDYMGKIENSGFIDVIEKKALPHGCYEYKWRYGNAQFKESTMFPKEWSASKVYEKVLESMKNTKEILYDPNKYPNIYEHRGLTSDGLIISTVIEFNEKSARVKSMYPYFPKVKQ